jgi:hypothetical protein
MLNIIIEVDRDWRWLRYCLGTDRTGADAEDMDRMSHNWRNSHSAYRDRRRAWPPQSSLSPHKGAGRINTIISLSRPDTFFLSIGVIWTACYYFITLTFVCVCVYTRAWVCVCASVLPANSHAIYCIYMHQIHHHEGWETERWPSVLCMSCYHNETKWIVAARTQIKDTTPPKVVENITNLWNVKS